MTTREGCLPPIAVIVASLVSRLFLKPFLDHNGQTGWVRFIVIIALYFSVYFFISYLWKPKKVPPKDEDES